MLARQLVADTAVQTTCHPLRTARGLLVEPIDLLWGGTRGILGKRLRLRLFAVAGRLASSGRRLRLRLAERWPWTGEITAAIARLQALPAGTPGSLRIA